MGLGSPTSGAQWVSFLLLTILASVASQPTQKDMLRAVRVVPHLNFSGASAQHASSRLNAHLLRQYTAGLGIGIRTCEAFHAGELDTVLLALAGQSETQLADVYNRANDNRRLEGEKTLSEQLADERKQLQTIRELNHSLGVHLGELSRDRKCIQAVMRYAHHLSSRKREALQKSGLVKALPLLPVVMGRDNKNAANYTHPVAKQILTSYRKAVAAIDCHIDVLGGCPGGTMIGCIEACPGVPDAPPTIEEQCRATCADACGFGTENTVQSKREVSSGHKGQDNRKRPAPPYWADSWQSVMSRNETREDGSDAGFRACMRWYDWTQFASRTDCTRDGATSTTLTVRGKIYVVMPGPPGCVVSDIGITPVSPAWLQEGAEYIGPQQINGVQCEVWDKKEGPGGDSHFYAVAADDNRPVQMLTTGPDLGEGRSSNQKDYIMYIEKKLDPNLFVPPPQCDNARELSWSEISTIPELTLD